MIKSPSAPTLNKHPKKFLIIGAARTGSTLLVKTLNTIEGIRCHGELLGPNKVRGFEDGIDLEHTSADERRAREERLLAQRSADPAAFLAAAMDGADQAAGFKMIYSTFALPQWQPVIAALLDDPAMWYIHLTRRNNLRRYISEEIANNGGPIHSGAGGRADVPAQITVDIEAFLANTAEVEQAHAAVAARLPAERTLDLSYEALAADTAGAVRTVCEFLDIDPGPGPIAAALSKVGAQDLRGTVSNYDALLEHPVTRALLEDAGT
jgi:LPS sulfotransferase NodH